MHLKVDHASTSVNMHPYTYPCYVCHLCIHIYIHITYVYTFIVMITHVLFACVRTHMHSIDS